MGYPIKATFHHFILRIKKRLKQKGPRAQSYKEGCIKMHPVSKLTAYEKSQPLASRIAKSYFSNTSD